MSEALTLTELLVVPRNHSNDQMASEPSKVPIADKRLAELCWEPKHMAFRLVLTSEKRWFSAKEKPLRQEARSATQPLGLHICRR